MKELTIREEPMWLPDYEERKTETVIDTIVIHAMYNPDVPFDERFLLTACTAILKHYAVSAHYLITPTGEVISCVPEQYRARHAGQSKMPFPDDDRSDVNEFSIGIELIGDWMDQTYQYPEAQYSALATLLQEILLRHPIREIVGHDHIAPERKNDPGPHFRWDILFNKLGRSFRVPSPHK